jgi:hypothetical protein
MRKEEKEESTRKIEETFGREKIGGRENKSLAVVIVGAKCTFFW